MEKTSPGAFNILLKSTHDICWAHGAFGESFGTYTHCFLGSCANFEAAPPHEDAMSGPLPNEPSITLNWALPLTESAQELLFSRIQLTFDRNTSMMPVTQRKKYRLSGDDLLRVRNLVCLFDQILPHIKARVGLDSAAQWLEDVRSGAQRDNDLTSLLHLRPSVFSMSMLPSEQEQAKRSLEEVELKKCEDKEAQRLEVTAAQWNFFKGALARDQSKLDVVQQAPRLVRQRLHAKQVAARSRLISDGESACKGYQDTVPGQFVPGQFVHV